MFKTASRLAIGWPVFIRSLELLTISKLILGIGVTALTYNWYLEMQAASIATSINSWMAC